MKLFPWTKDFCPNSYSSTSAQVWVRIYGLPLEYRRPRILFAIDGSVGTPICTDSASTKPMIERTFDQFARVLVDMDITQTLRYKVLVERKHYSFFVELDCENIPDFCNHCLKVGHHIDFCKNLKTNDVKDGEEISNRNNTLPKQPVWHRKPTVSKQGNDVTDPIIVGNSKDIVGNVENTNSGIILANNNAGTSGAKKNFEIPQSNTFDALKCHESNHDPIIQAMKDADTQLEREVNLQLENQAECCETEASSQGTEFVDATQLILQSDDNDSLNQDINFDDANDQIEPTRKAATVEEIEKHNREFLKQSWANITDDVEAEQRFLQHLETDLPHKEVAPSGSDGFHFSCEIKR